MRCLFILVLGLFSLNLSNAQTLSIEQRTFMHNDQPRPSIRVIVEAPPKFLKKEWADYLKDEYDVKLKGIGFLSNKDMLTAEKAVLPPLSSKALDLYTHFSADNGQTTFHVFAAYGYDMYAGQGKFTQDIQELQSITQAFLDQLLPRYFQEEAERASDRVDELTDDINDLQDGIADNEKEIKKLRKEIASMQKDLEEKNEQLKTAEAEWNRAQNRARNIKKVLDRERKN